jgi:hypothetical protein
MHGIWCGALPELRLVPVLYAIFVLDLKILKWEEKEKKLSFAPTETAAD